jgi:hypothetical protein
VNETERRKAEHKQLQVAYRALYDDVLEILFSVDPIGVHQQHETEKYVPEVVTILPRLRDAKSIVEVKQILHEELRRWYGSRVAITSPEHLHQAATDVWFAWQCFLGR